MKTGELAKQFTLIDFELLSNIKICELRDKVLDPQNGKHESVTAMSDRFNQVSENKPPSSPSLLT